MGSSTSGYPLWNKWFTVGNSIGFQVNELSFDCSDLEKRVAIIGRESAQRSQQLLHVEETDPLAFLKASLSLALNDSRLRSQIVGDASNVRVWFDNIEIAVHAASLQLSESGHERVEASLNAFRREKLGEIPGQSISSRILNRVGCDKSDIEKLCTELMLATKE
jgi:hypothetical protein